MTRQNQAWYEHYTLYEKAYSIFTDENRTESAQFNDMQRFLGDCVKLELITNKERFQIASAVMETVWA